MSTLFYTFVYRLSKDEEIFSPNILMIKKTLSFLSEGLAVWRLSRNQFKPVWAETVKNYPARKLELLIPQNRYIGHQCGIWKIMGKAIFFEKGFLLIKVHVKLLEAVETGWKSPFFNICKRFHSLAKLNFLKDSSNPTLYLLNIIGCWPIFGQFQYAKLSSYKIVRWGQLAGPSYMLTWKSHILYSF